MKTLDQSGQKEEMLPISDSLLARAGGKRKNDGVKNGVDLHPTAHPTPHPIAPYPHPMGCYGVKVLELLDFLLRSSIGLCTLSGSLFLCLEAQRVKWGADDLSGVPPFIIGVYILFILAAPLALVCADWFKSEGRHPAARAFRCVSIFTLLCNLWFTYQGAATYLDKTAQDASDEQREVSKRSKRLADIEDELKTQRTDARWKTPEQVQNLIDELITANGKIWERSHECMAGYVSSKDGLSEKLCNQVQPLRTQKTAAERVAKLEQEQRTLWAPDVEPKEQKRGEPKKSRLRLDSSVESTLAIINLIIGKPENDEAGERRRSSVRYTIAITISTLSELIGYFGFWAAFTVTPRKRVPAFPAVAQEPDQPVRTARAKAALPKKVKALPAPTPAQDQSPGKRWAKERMAFDGGGAVATEIQDDFQWWAQTNNVDIGNGHWPRRLKEDLLELGLVLDEKSRPKLYRGASLKPRPGIRQVK